jgi:hypothetical protein
VDHSIIRNETPVRQGEFGQRSGFLPFGVDPYTNQESGCSRTFLGVSALFWPSCRYRIGTEYVVCIATPRPKRRATASVRALEALEASQALPTVENCRTRASRPPQTHARYKAVDGPSSRYYCKYAASMAHVITPCSRDIAKLEAYLQA